MITVTEVINTVEAIQASTVVVEENDTTVIVSTSTIIPQEIVYTVEVNGEGIQGATGPAGLDGWGATPLGLELTYDIDGNLSLIEYSDGATKELSYLAGVLDESVYTNGAEVVTKNFFYNLSGDLESVVVS